LSSIKDRLRKVIGRADADYVDVRFEEGDSTDIDFRRDHIEGVSTSRMAGGVVRACTKGGWAYTTFDAISDVDKAIEEACHGARLVGDSTTEIAEPDNTPTDAEVVVDMVEDPRGVSLDDKIALVREYNDAMLSYDGIATTDVAYIDRLRTVTFMSSRGVCFSEQRPGCAITLQATGRDGDLLQTASDALRSRNNFDALRNQHAAAHTVGKRASDLLKARVCPAGTTTVVLDPELAGVFMHEAFGHLSEADHIYEDKKLKELVHIGREVGTKELNVVDDGTIADRPGTTAFDDEGTPPQKTYLIKEGVLVGYMHTLETAGKMGHAATGNGRAGGRNHRPLVRMTNTLIESGPVPKDDVFKGIEDGIYACGMFGGNTQLEIFSFSAAYGFMIENGQVTDMVRDVMLAGNVFKTLYSIDAIGDDLTIPPRGGGCGKGGQGVPVSVGSPHIRIRDVVVGGR
jgi:TldD protein